MIFVKLAAHPAMVRWGAVALVVGAVLGMTRAFLLLSFLVFGVDLSVYLVGYSYVVSVLLLDVGMFGVLCASPLRMERLRKVMLAGISISAVGAATLLIGLTYELLALSESPYPNPLLNAVFTFGNLAGHLGLVVVGVAALWVRGLAFARFLVLPASLLISPLIGVLFEYLVYPRFGYDGAFVENLYLVIPTLAGAFWIAVGIVLFGAREREAKFITQEQGLVERKNLEVARKLYEEAWGRGEYGVLDDYVSPEVVDAYHEEVGLANFRRNIMRLRRTFPDLDFEIEAQTPDGETVTTRWNLTGTDEGGILWYPPTGERVSLSGEFTDRFEDELLVEHRGASDMRSLMDRLGLG